MTKQKPIKPRNCLNARNPEALIFEERKDEAKTHITKHLWR